VNLGTLIRRAALQFKDAPCLVEGERSISFAEFDAATDRLANALRARGLQTGDRVSVLLPNSIDCLIAYYAIAKAGLVRLALNSRENLDSHNYKIADSGSRAVLHNRTDGLEAEILVDQDELATMIAGGQDTPCLVERDLDDVFRLGYTGGTTGRPKAVVLSNRGELAELSAFLMDLVPELRASDTFLHAAPIAHASGAFFLPSLVRGVRSVIMPKFDPAQFIQLAAREQAGFTFLVPTMLAMIMEEPGLEEAELDLTRICYGASPMAPGLLARAQQRFGQVFAQTYGQAESPMVITCLRPEDHDRIGAAGRPFTFVECAVFDDDDNPLPPGEIGEIVCRGPQLMMEYWNRPEATAEVMRNGWLHTGDIGRMDEDGFYYLLDRKHDLLISGGYNVYPREVEDVLLAFDGVVEAAVIGLPDEKWGDRVHAVVAGREDLDVDALAAYAKDTLADFKRPRGIDVWPELPKSAANKILRREIRDRLVAKEGNTV
jgi:acyl-CoA synthetase (AMP-forming)/AMP-acid ligase II